jgi:hypothetical protein
MPSNPGGITPAINHREYRDLLLPLCVIDRKGKSPAKQAVVICVHNSVDPRINPETLNVRFDRIYEIVSEPDLL